MSISWKHEYRTSCFQSHNESQEFSTCHWRWRLCPFPRIVFYWLLQSQDSRQRCHADFSKCHAVADDATSWNSIHYSDRSNLAVEIHFLEFYESNLTKVNFEIFFVYRFISINTVLNHLLISSEASWYHHLRNNLYQGCQGACAKLFVRSIATKTSQQITADPLRIYWVFAQGL